jgi:hypothetical protein
MISKADCYKGSKKEYVALACSIAGRVQIILEDRWMMGGLFCVWKWLRRAATREGQAHIRLTPLKQHVS